MGPPWSHCQRKVFRLLFSSEGVPGSKRWACPGSIIGRRGTLMGLMVWKARETRNPPSPSYSLGLALEAGTAWVPMSEKRWCSHMETGRGWGLWVQAILSSDCLAACSFGFYAPFLSCAKPQKDISFVSSSPWGWSPHVSRSARRDRRFLRWPTERKVRVVWAGDDPLHSTLRDWDASIMSNGFQISFLV